MHNFFFALHNVFNCKQNWFCCFQKEKFLSLCSISNHALMIIQKLSQCLPSPKSPDFLNYCSLPGSFRRWSVFFSSCWGRFCLGTSPRSLPYPVALPGELVRPSNESSLGSAVWRVRTPVQKRTGNTVRWHASSFILGFLRSSTAEPSVWWLKGLAWWESCWRPPEMLQKPVIEKSSTTLREFENPGL